MVQITVDMDTSNIGQLAGKVPEIKSRGLSYASQAMVLALMQNSPVDHGTLKSWFIESMDDTEAHIKSPAAYAIYQDQGTKAHMIYHKSKKALFWGAYDGKKPIMSKGHMIPAMPGKHFVQRSIDQVGPQLEGFFLRALHEVMD